MKLHIGLLDVLVICALVFAGILGHNYWTAHPTAREKQWLNLVAVAGKLPTVKKSQGGGGMEFEAGK